MAEFGDDLLDDFRNFLFLGLKKLYGVKPTPMQYSIAEWVSTGPKLRLSQAPRGIGKSTITQFFVVWDIWRDFVRTDGHPSVQWMTVCGTRDLAVQFTQYAKQLMESIRQLRVLIPTDPERWSMQAIDVTGAVPAPSPTLFARGVFGRMTGDRALKIAFDDIEIPQNAETQGQRDKLRRRCAEFLDVLKPGGEIVGLGTPQVEDSLYNILPGWSFVPRIWTAEYPDDRWMSHHGSKLAPWIADQLKEGPGLVGNPTDPVRFPEHELAQRRASGLSRYRLQYMLDTSLSDEDRYPLKLRDLIVMDLDPELGPERPIWSSAPEYRRQDLPCPGLTGDGFYGPMGVAGDPTNPKEGVFVPYEQKILAVDPSGKGKNETAWVVLGAVGGIYYLLDAGGMQGGYEDHVLEHLSDLAARYTVDEVPLEENYGGGMFEALLTRKLQERAKKERERGVTEWRGAVVTPVRHSTMKEARIIDALEPVMNQHRLVVASRVIEEDHPGEGENGALFRLFHQMSRIARVKGALVYDDRLDALAIGVRHLTDRMVVDQERHAQRRRDEQEQKMWDEYWEEVGHGPQRGESMLDHNRGAKR